MKSPTLSVVIPNYNHARYIGEALEAVLSQSLKPTEIIIIDDASTDNSLEVIKKYIEKDLSIKLIINEKNMGANYNFNKLFEVAVGDYIYPTSADDKILPGLFEKSMNLLSQYPQAGLCSTLTVLIDERGIEKGLLPSTGIISLKECYVSPEKARSILLKYGSWINTTIYRRDALINEGSFRPELHSFCDGFIQMVIALKYGSCFIPGPLGCWRHLEGGYHISSSRNINTQLEIIKNATDLMETTYKDVFPIKVVSRWRKKQLFLLNLNIWKASQQGAIAALSRFKEADGLFDKLLLAFSKLFTKIEQSFVMLYFFALHRYFPIQIIRRNIVSFFRRMMLHI